MNVHEAMGFVDRSATVSILSTINARSSVDVARWMRRIEVDVPGEYQVVLDFAEARIEHAEVTVRLTAAEALEPGAGDRLQRSRDGGRRRPFLYCSRAGGSLPVTVTVASGAEAGLRSVEAQKSAGIAAKFGWQLPAACLTEANLQYSP